MNQEFDIDRLTPAAKVEALRVGHHMIVIHEELMQVLAECGDFILEHETYILKPLGDIGGGQRVYSVRIVPIIQSKG